MSTPKSNKNVRMPLLIVLAFVLAVGLNIGLNLWQLLEEGKATSAQFNAQQMSIASDKLIQLTRLTESQHGKVPILVLGSSHAHGGLNPKKLSFNYPVFNMSMKGTFFKSQLFLLKLLLKENKKPPFVILEISPLLTNIHLREYFIRRPILPYLLAHHPDYLLTELKEDPQSWVMFFQMIQNLHPVKSLLGEKKHKVYFTPLGYEPRREPSGAEKKDLERYKQLTWDYVYDYQFDMAEAEKLITVLKKENIPYVFVAYPISPPMREALDEKGVLKQFETALATLEKKHHASIIDATRWYNTIDDFYDGNHLSGNGANKFTQQLSPLLQNPIRKAFQQEEQP